jgi:hypothetical protein
MDVSRLNKQKTDGCIKVWFPMGEGMDVLMRYVPQDEYDALSEACTESTIDPATLQRTKTRDNEKFRKELAKAETLDWRGVFNGKDDAGKEVPYPCTPENIEILVQKWTEYRMLVMGTPLQLAAMLEAEREAERKNS